MVDYKIEIDKSKIVYQETSKLQVVHKWLSIGAGSLMVVNGTLRYILITSLLNQQMLVVFQPAYQILFGVIFVVCQFNQERIKQYLPFMSRYVGRGVLAFFAATLTFSSLGSMFLIVLSVVITLQLAVIGIISFSLHSRQIEVLPPTTLKKEVAAIKLPKLFQNNNNANDAAASPNGQQRSSQEEIDSQNTNSGKKQIMGSHAYSANDGDQVSESDDQKVRIVIDDEK